MASTYRNPILPGFHPDPSVCRVGKDYYLVTSSFEYFPGVPVFHSRDLVHWRRIGHCLGRESQLPLRNAKSSAGIWAPTIRWHDGVFYMVTTNVSHGGNFYVTATDPAGPWSEPVWLQDPGALDGGGIDPSLFFDEDGKVYYTRESMVPLGIAQCEIDLAAGRLRGEPRLIWSGTGGAWPEGPHLYKRAGTYYLMISEGGCWLGHMVTVARASSPWGPFEPCPRNPILTHRHLCGLDPIPIQGVGHGDLVQAHDDSWWMVCLGHRPEGGFHRLGRETLLAPVRWDSDGWPEAGDGGIVPECCDAPGLEPVTPPADPVRDDFDAPEWRLCWNFRGNPDPADFSLVARPGFLRLLGSAGTLDDAVTNTFVGRRQQNLDFRVTTAVEFMPGSSREEAGLTVLADERHHYEIGIGHDRGARHVFVRRRTGDLSVVVARESVSAQGRLHLRVTGKPDTYRFELAGAEPRTFTTLAEAAGRYLSQEVTAGCTGVYIGLYATGSGRQCAGPADFDWFEYEDL